MSATTFPHPSRRRHHEDPRAGKDSSSVLWRHERRPSPTSVHVHHEQRTQRGTRKAEAPSQSDAMSGVRASGLPELPDFEPRLDPLHGREGSALDVAAFALAPEVSDELPQSSSKAAAEVPVGGFGAARAASGAGPLRPAEEWGAVPPPAAVPSAVPMASQRYVMMEGVSGIPGVSGVSGVPGVPGVTMAPVAMPAAPLAPQQLPAYRVESGAADLEDDYGMGAIKLFVGQIPKDIGEDHLRPIFEKYGEIFELAVIRDRHTGAHRGCAFLTYKNKESGDMAIRELHNRMLLPKAHNPLQVKPAAGRAERENKLFVGMMPRSASEPDVGAVFSRFGEIREIYIIRDQDGASKGCAFLKFKNRSSALAAIRELNDKYTMEGAPRPLIVKFADNKRPQRKRDERVGSSGRGRAESAPAMAGPYGQQQWAQVTLAPRFYAAGGAVQASPTTTLIPIANDGKIGSAPVMYYQPVVAHGAVGAPIDGGHVQLMAFNPTQLPVQQSVPYAKPPRHSASDSALDRLEASFSAGMSLDGAAGMGESRSVGELAGVVGGGIGNYRGMQDLGRAEDTFAPLRDAQVQRPSRASLGQTPPSATQPQQQQPQQQQPTLPPQQQQRERVWPGLGLGGGAMDGAQDGYTGYPW